MSNLRASWALRVAGFGATALAILLLPFWTGPHTPYRVQAATRIAAAPGGVWSAIYVLGEDCACSARAAAYLASRSPAIWGDRVRRSVTIVGGRSASGLPLRWAGWPVEQRTAAQAERLYGARSAPVLLIADSEGTVRYAGGFAGGWGGRGEFRDLALITDVLAGREVRALPVYGCTLGLRVHANQGD